MKAWRKRGRAASAALGGRHGLPDAAIVAGLPVDARAALRLALQDWSCFVCGLRCSDCGQLSMLVVYGQGVHGVPLVWSDDGVAAPESFFSALAAFDADPIAGLVRHGFVPFLWSERAALLAVLDRPLPAGEGLH